MRRKFIFLLFSSFMFCVRGIAQGKDTSINVYFDINSFELDVSQLEILEKFIASYPNPRGITGFADSTGGNKYNLVLSEKRALSVYRLLQVGNNVTNKNIVSFKGESNVHPFPQMNRRVEITSQMIWPLTSIPGRKDTRADTVSNFYLDFVYFIPDKPIITYESEAYIEELAKNLKSYQTGTFEIIGHINYQSRFDSTHLTDLYLLSELRAKAVYERLIEAGIPETRMRYKGVGNAHPLYPSPLNDEQRKKNMRVQIVVKK
jgi:outer membrane protein OmpA-like peptidoglycan-associated protein